ncbi:hypothetical protein ACI0FR_01783 [Paenochrobactrum sp. BZR 201-1]
MPVVRLGTYSGSDTQFFLSSIVRKMPEPLKTARTKAIWQANFLILRSYDLSFSITAYTRCNIITKIVICSCILFLNINIDKKLFSTISSNKKLMIVSSCQICIDNAATNGCGSQYNHHQNRVIYCRYCLLPHGYQRQYARHKSPICPSLNAAG